MARAIESWNVEQTTYGRGGCVSIMRPSIRMERDAAELLARQAKAAMPDTYVRVVCGRWTRKGFVGP